MVNSSKTIVKKKRTFKKRKTGFLDKKYSVRQIANTAMSTAMKVAKLINVEKKIIDTVVSTNTQFPNTGYVDNLSLCAEGDTETNRNGLSIKCISNYLNFTIKENPSATNTCARVLLVLAYQPRGVAPAISDVLEAVTINSPLNHIKKNRFKVLLDKTYNLCSGGDSRTIGEKFYSSENYHIKYNSSGGAIGQLEQNGLFLMYFCDEVVNYPYITYYNRLKFVDN